MFVWLTMKLFQIFSRGNRTLKVSPQRTSLRSKTLFKSKFLLFLFFKSLVIFMINLSFISWKTPSPGETCRVNTRSLFVVVVFLSRQTSTRMTQITRDKQEKL